MSRRASVHVTRQIDTDGGESPNAFVPLITIDIRVHFPPHTPPMKVANLFLNTAAETVNQIRDYVDEQPRNVWLAAPVTSYTAEQVAELDNPDEWGVAPEQTELGE